MLPARGSPRWKSSGPRSSLPSLFINRTSKRIPTELILLIARLLQPSDLLNLARALPGIDRYFAPRHWLPLIDRSGNTIFHLSAAEGADEIIDSLLLKKFDCTINNGNGYTALHFSAQSGHLSTTELLLLSGLDPNFPAVGGVSALGLAAIRGHSLVAQKLISYGAKISISTAGGYTMLHWAVLSNSLPMLEILLQSGADPTTLDDFGRSPLHYAASTGNLQMMEILVSAGSDPFWADHDGNDPFHILFNTGVSKLLFIIYMFQLPACRHAILTFILGCPWWLRISPDAQECGNILSSWCARCCASNFSKKDRPNTRFSVSFPSLVWHLLRYYNWNRYWALDKWLHDQKRYSASVKFALLRPILRRTWMFKFFSTSSHIISSHFFFQIHADY